MSIGFIRALAILHHTFKDHSPAQRAHVLGRFLSAPFLRTIDLVPRGARVLDIGAGHGLFARLIAEETARDVVAIDPDLRKMLTSYRHPKIRFVAGFDDAVRGTFDAVTVFDVLYRLDDAGRDALLVHTRDLLRPGGTILVKDLDPAARVKSAWNRFQERGFADLLQLTVGKFGENDTREQMAARLSRAGFVGVRWKRIDFCYPHAHIVYTATRP